MGTETVSYDVFCGKVGKVNAFDGWVRRRESGAWSSQGSGLGYVSCCWTLTSFQGHTLLHEGRHQ